MFRNTFQSGFISVFSASGSHPLQLWDIHLLEDDGQIRLIEDRTRDGNAKHDDESNHLSEPVLEMMCLNLPQNYIICPLKLDTSPERCSLGITLPFLYLNVYMPECSDQEQQQQQRINHLSVEVAILDNKQITRRFRCSTFQSTTSIKADICTFPLRLTQRSRALKRDGLLLSPLEQLHHSQQISNEEDYEPCWNRVCIPLAQYTSKAYGTILSETKSIQIHGTHFHLHRVYFAEKQVSEDELPQEFRLWI